MKKILVTGLLACSSLAMAYSGNPPQAVLAAFQQRFPNAQDVDWSKEKNGDWEAEFEMSDDRELSATFSAEGQWLETETEISFSDLPVPVQTALKGKKVKEVARIENVGGSTVFEAEVRHKDLLFDASGKKLE